GQWLAAAPVGSPVSAVGASSLPLELQLEDPCDASWETYGSSDRWRQLNVQVPVSFILLKNSSGDLQWSALNLTGRPACLQLLDVDTQICASLDNIGKSSVGDPICFSTLLRSRDTCAGSELAASTSEQAEVLTAAAIERKITLNSENLPVFSVKSTFTFTVSKWMKANYINCKESFATIGSVTSVVKRHSITAISEPCVTRIELEQAEFWREHEVRTVRVRSDSCSFWPVSHSCWLIDSAVPFSQLLKKVQSTDFSSEHQLRVSRWMARSRWLVRCQVNQSGVEYPDVETSANQLPAVISGELAKIPLALLRSSIFVRIQCSGRQTFRGTAVYNISSSATFPFTLKPEASNESDPNAPKRTQVVFIFRVVTLAIGVLMVGAIVVYLWFRNVPNSTGSFCQPTPRAGRCAGQAQVNGQKELTAAWVVAQAQVQQTSPADLMLESQRALQLRNPSQDDTYYEDPDEYWEITIRLEDPCRASWETYGSSDRWRQINVQVLVSFILLKNSSGDLQWSALNLTGRPACLQLLDVDTPMCTSLDNIGKSSVGDPICFSVRDCGLKTTSSRLNCSIRNRNGKQFRVNHSEISPPDVLVSGRTASVSFITTDSSPEPRHVCWIGASSSNAPSSQAEVLTAAVIERNITWNSENLPVFSVKSTFTFTVSKWMKANYINCKESFATTGSVTSVAKRHSIAAISEPCVTRIEFEQAEFWREHEVRTVRVRSDSCSFWPVSHSCWLIDSAVPFSQLLKKVQSADFSSEHQLWVSRWMARSRWLVRCQVNQSGVEYPDVETSANQLPAVFLFILVVTGVCLYVTAKQATSGYSNGESQLADLAGSIPQADCSDGQSEQQTSSKPAIEFAKVLQIIDQVTDQYDASSGSDSEDSNSDSLMFTTASGHYDLDGCTFVKYKEYYKDSSSKPIPIPESATSIN
uniref:Ig-like domain-containing protein n=1 Tax=Macrostomum lignano TaxID=282301 RepID=A0A1I8J8U2_9PLAT